MFGIGMQEILLLMMLAGGAVVAVLLVLLLTRHGRGRVAELEAENRRLREELDRQRGRG